MKKGKKCVDLYAGNGPNDRFGTVFDGMVTSEKFQSLSLGARYFYILCRVQSQSKHGKACLYKHREEYGRTYGDKCFVFPASHQRMYGVDKGNSSRYLSELTKAGFIECIENNSHMRKVNVYAFSDKWKGT